MRLLRSRAAGAGRSGERRRCCRHRVERVQRRQRDPGCSDRRAVALRQRQAQLVAFGASSATRCASAEDHAAAVVHPACRPVAGRRIVSTRRPHKADQSRYRISSCRSRARRRVRAIMSMPVAPSCSAPVEPGGVVLAALHRLSQPPTGLWPLPRRRSSQTVSDQGGHADAGVVARPRAPAGVGTELIWHQAHRRFQAPAYTARCVSGPMRRVSCRFRRAMSNEDELAPARVA